MPPSPTASMANQSVYIASPFSEHRLTHPNMIRLLVINPNTSDSITRALKRAIGSSIPADVNVTFFTPSTGVPSINDDETAAISSSACLREIDASNCNGMLVCCFRDHPLIYALRQTFPHVTTIGMFQAGVASALLHDGPFGIIATGTGAKPNIVKSVADLLGSPTSTRFAGVKTTGLGVVELQEGDQDHVKRQMQETAAFLVDQGATTLIFGCAGMSGMENIMPSGVRVIDAARMGVHTLAATLRK